MTEDTTSLERRLAAILAADVVGYSKLVEQNAESTIKAVKSLWQNIIDPSARQEGGRVVKTMGDGVLAEFPSAVRAVQCALNVQEALAAGDTAFPDGIRLVLRIGLHLGDIIIDGDDIFGDGVNLAARLESLAEPGGVCISAAVMDQLAAEIAAAFADNGEQTVKNISRPVHTYVLRQDKHGTASPDTRRKSDDRKPTLAIGTFAALTKDDTTEVLTQGCQQTTAALLSGLTGLTLISPKTQPDYLAEARFQVLGDRYRCMLSLAETQDDRPVLNTRLEGQIDDLFDAQDKLSSLITNALRYAVMNNEADKAAEDESATDEQILARAGQLMMGPVPEEWATASALLEKYLERHPESFMALSMKACVLMIEPICGIGVMPSENVERTRDLLAKAHKLNEQSDFMHLIRCVMLLQVDFDLDAATLAIERALQVNPDYALAKNSHAICLSLLGEDAAARKAVLAGIEGLAGNRIQHRLLSTKAFCDYSAGDYEAAIAAAQQSLEQAPAYPLSLAMLATSAAALGRQELAESAMKKLRQVQPHLTLARVRHFPYRDENKTLLIREHLHQAGLPES